MNKPIGRKNNSIQCAYCIYLFIIIKKYKIKAIDCKQRAKRNVGI